jgi:hypothetical protein
MKKTLFAIGAFAMLAMVGCSATLPSAMGGSIQKNSGKKVTASVSNFNLLGLSPTSLDKMSEVSAQLQSQCSGGAVTGVASTLSETYLVIGFNETISASGFCL